MIYEFAAVATETKCQDVGRRLKVAVLVRPRYQFVYITSFFIVVVLPFITKLQAFSPFWAMQYHLFCIPYKNSVSLMTFRMIERKSNEMRRDEAAENEDQRILEQSEIEMNQETGTERSNACVVHLSSLSPIPVSEVLGLFRLLN